MASDGLIRIDIEVDGKQITVASNALDSLEAAAQRSGKGAKSVADGMSSLSSSSSKASKDVASTSGAVDNLASTSTSASKNVAGAASNLGDLSNISSSASKNLQGATSAIGDIAGGSTAATRGVSGTSDSLNDLGNTATRSGQGVAGVTGSMSNLLSTSTGVSGGLGSVNGSMTALLNSSTNATGGVQGATGSLNNMGGSADNAADAARRAAQETQNVGNESSRASMGIKEIAISLGLVELASAAFNVLKSALDSAIARFDTLAGFPVVMERMGFSSEQASDSISKLSGGIQGLPTTLNGIVASTQRIAVLTGDLDTATDTALSLNNAFLASGSSAMDAERGLTQYVQMLSKGSVDIMSWRTLQETMGYALKETAKEFGFAGKSAQNDLYDALKGGEVTFEEFNAKIIELNNSVGGFADMAATGSEGIATSMGNLRNAFVVGVANIITSFDNLSRATTDKSIYKNIDGLKVVVSSAFKVIGSVIESAAPIVISFASAVQAAIPVVQALAPAIVGLMAAYAGYMVITSVTAAVKASNAVLAIAQASQIALTVATKAQMAAAVASTTATGVNAAATVAQTGAVTLSTLAIGVLTGKVTLSTVAQIAGTAATVAWGAAIQFMMGPIGWVTAGIGLLVTGIIALVKWFNRTTEEGAKLNTQTDALATSTGELSTAVEGSSKAYEKNQENLETNAHAYTELVEKVEELAAKEKKSAEEKKALKSYIDELNRSVDGLNLVYGEQSQALNMTSEEMVNRINLMKEEQGLLSSQERLTELIKEEIDIGLQRKDVNALIKESNQLYEDGEITKKENSEAVNQLKEQETALSEAHTKAGAERIKVEEGIIESSGKVAAAAEEDMGQQLLLFDELGKELQKTVESMKSSWEDYKDKASDMFDTIETKSTVSVGKMTKNLEENQRIITKWSENIATLAKRGIDEGLLNTLREAGPESAGHVNALVKASDDELKKLSTAFANGGEVATNALSKSLGIEKTGIMKEIGHLVVNTEKSLADQIKGAGFETVGGGIPEGLAKGIKDGSKDVEKSTQDMAKAAEDAAKDALEQNSPSKVFERIGDGLPEGMVLGVNNGTKDVIKAMKDLSKSMVDQFKTTPKQFETIGRNVAEGFERGIKDNEAKLLATAKGIADSVIKTTKKALDINSPSGEFEDIGKWVGEGMKIGIDSTRSANEKAAIGLINVLIDATKKNADEVAKISTEAEKKRTEIQNDYAKKRAELSKKTATSSQSALKTHKNKKGEIVLTGEAKVYKIRSDASSKLTKLNEDEQKKLATINTKAWNDMQKKEAELSKSRLESVKLYIADKKSLDEMTLESEASVWEKSISLFTEGTKERVAAQTELKKAIQAIDKERLEDVRQFIADKKSLEEMSVVDEVVIWDKAVDSFKAGTKEKITAQTEYAKALEVVNKEITSVNDKYAKDMQRINDDFQKQETDLTKKYKESLEGRTKALYSFAGTFDEFDIKTEKSGAELLKNLDTQVSGFKKWQFEIETLAKRAIDDGLLAELRDMGPKALGELMALNSMSDEQLSQYSALYQEKSALARTQAEAELIGMKEDTEKQIGELRNVATAELSALQVDWNNEIKSLTGGTANELSSLEQIGRDAVQGLVDGMQSMHADLQAAANAIADSVSGTIKDALDIHSPSRVMHQVGEWTVQGLLDGLASKSDEPSKIVTDIGKSIIDATQWYADKILAIEDDKNRILNHWNKDNRNAIISVDASEKMELSELNEKYAKGEIQGLRAYESQKLSIVKKWSKEREVYVRQANQTEINFTSKHNEEINSLKQIMQVHSFNALKSTLDKAREANELTALEEMRIWSQAAQSFEENSYQMRESIEHYKDAHVRASEEMKIKTQELRDHETKMAAEITAEYDKAVADRSKSIASFAGIFDEFKIQTEKSGADLMTNLQSQVDGFKSWQETITELSSKAINEGLLAELKALGPKAAGELAALNAMTDAELEAYSKLYQEKQALAREQAEIELVGMKDDTKKRIEELRNATQGKLDELNAVWNEATSLIVFEADAELAKLHGVGVNAGQGLLDGLTSMEGALVAKAASIAENIKGAMAGALDIHSPSRWMRDFLVGNMTLGFIKGVDKDESKIVSAANKFAEFMMPNMADITIPNVNIRPFNPSFGGSGNGSSSTDNRKTVTNKIENHFTPAESTPSESARKQEQMLRRLAMEF